MRRVIIVALMLLGMCGGVKAQWTEPAPPYQLTGSGIGLSHNGAPGSWNLAYTANGTQCNATGFYGPCQLDWTTQVSSTTFTGTFTPNTTEVFFCNRMNYEGTTFNEFNLCFHAIARLCTTSPGCPGGIRLFHQYWATSVELDRVDGSSNLITLWSIFLGNVAPNGQTVPLSGWLHMRSNVTGVQYCQTVSYTVGYSPDNVNWNNYNSAAVDCSGYTTTAAGFLISSGSGYNTSATASIAQWYAADNSGHYVHALTLSVTGSTQPGNWCDTDGGVLSCVGQYGTT